MSELIYRLTNHGRGQLLQLAKDKPDLWFDPNTDFGAELGNIGVTDYAEETSSTSSGLLSLPSGSHYGQRERFKMDRNAPAFCDILQDVSPEQANDGRMWEWLCHFRLHRYCYERWPGVRNDNQFEHIMLHWFIRDRDRDVYQNNTASRTFWVGTTAERIAEASGGTLTKQQVAEHLSENPVTYHNIMHWDFSKNPSASALIMEALVKDGRGEGISSGGSITLWKQLNLSAGKVLPEALTEREWIDNIDENLDDVMATPANVKSRWHLRGSRPYRVLSLGAGAQSTVLALMAGKGEYDLPQPDIAIFADTGWEPPAVYEHLDWLEKQLSYPVIRVDNGNIRENLMNGVMPDGSKFIGIPAYLAKAGGDIGIMRRQCTTHYKLKPIHRAIRKELGLQAQQLVPKHIKVEMWIGISADEVDRAKPSREEWIEKRFPLVELGFHRAQLHGWFQANYPDRALPKSACIGCPYHSDAVWKDIKENDPSSFMQAIQVDIALRENPNITPLVPGAKAYLHGSRKPLALVEFEDTTGYQDQMNEECEGLCGI